MTAANLGTKRQCPKCSAKFYDFGANPIKCPKCAHSWKEAVEAKSKPVKPKKETPVKKPVKAVIDEEDTGTMPDDLPEIEDGEETVEIEPMEEEEVEMTSLEEVGEHEEEAAADPNSDDAEDDMFHEVAGEEKLVDDLEQYIETDDDEGEEE
jgi:uncharacterized protein (TIGR02300 family)